MKKSRIKLIKLRLSKNMTQKEIAKKLGVSRSFYTMIENGKRNPSLELAMKIARLFDVDVNDIFLQSSCKKEIY